MTVLGLAPAQRFLAGELPEKTQWSTEPFSVALTSQIFSYYKVSKAGLIIIYVIHRGEDMKGQLYSEVIRSFCSISFRLPVILPTP